MAPRFLSEQLIGTVEKTVKYELQQRQVAVIDEDLVSPGGSCPMVRKYLNVPTPQTLQISIEFAEEVHQENLRLHLRVEAEFKAAREASNKRLEERRAANRARDKDRRARNVAAHGTAKKPRQAASLATPATREGPRDRESCCAVDGAVQQLLAAAPVSFDV